jgi:hypothetical protein
MLLLEEKAGGARIVAGPSDGDMGAYCTSGKWEVGRKELHVNTSRRKTSDCRRSFVCNVIHEHYIQ